MTTKKPTALLALVGACALAATGPASLAAPTTPTPPQPTEQATASSLPVGDIDTALTSKSGQSAPSSTGAEADPARVVGVIVQLEDGASREASLASINEAVAGVYPDATVEVEREYKNALQGYALRVPEGSLDAIRGVSGVKLASIERETRVQ